MSHCMNCQGRWNQGGNCPLYFAMPYEQHFFLHMIVYFCLPLHIFRLSDGLVLYERWFYAEIPWLLAKLILYWLRYISTILYNRKSNFELNTKNPHWSIWEYICLFLFYFSDMYQHFRVCLYLYINIGHSISGLVEPGK